MGILESFLFRCGNVGDVQAKLTPHSITANDTANIIENITE